MKMTAVLIALAVASGCSREAQVAAPAESPASAEIMPTTAAPATTPVDVPAGRYTLDLSHGSLLFRVNHLGFSNYTARFRRFDATLDFDPRNLAASKVEATVDVSSLETDFPDPSKVDFNATLIGPEWLNAAAHPQMTWRSTKVEETAPNQARVTGDLTLRGVTRPVVLDVTFNGGYRGHPMDPNARIGFSARGELKRSEFGIAVGIPAAGSTMGVSDGVQIIIEAEFNGPPMQSSIGSN
jgi:polyisoprenoid-binding protein YceI